MTDPISDMLTRIRNVQAVGRSTVDIPFSKIKFSLAEILVRKGLVKSAEKKGRGAARRLEIELIYEDKKNTIPKISQLKRVSKPGKREYVRAKDIRLAFGGKRGIIIISTSKGLMTGREAKKKGLGGEILCEIL